MSDTSFTITRRRLLATIIVVALASAATGVGTVALLSDSESSDGNAIQAGTLDLELNGGDQTVTILDTAGIEPGDTGNNSITLQNNGSVPGVLEVNVTSIESHENGLAGPESGQDSGPDGELDEWLSVNATVDGGTQVWQEPSVSSLSEGTVYTPGTTIANGDSTTFTLDWRLPSDTSNMAQSDSVEMDLTFRLVQSGP